MIVLGQFISGADTDAEQLALPGKRDFGWALG